MDLHVKIHAEQIHDEDNTDRVAQEQEGVPSKEYRDGRATARAQNLETARAQNPQKFNPQRTAMKWCLGFLQGPWCLQSSDEQQVWKNYQAQIRLSSKDGVQVWIVKDLVTDGYFVMK